MKKYTIYTTNRKDFDKRGWQSSSRKQIDNSIDNSIEDIEKTNELYVKYNMPLLVYKIVDNTTNDIISTNI